MGKQINFYMDHIDEREFLDTIFQNDPVLVIVGERNTQEMFPKFDSIEEVANFEDTEKYYRFHLLRKDISQDLKVKKYTSYYYAEPFHSLAIEFSRSKSFGVELQSGRLYISPADWWDNGLDQKKIKGIVRWYDQLARWIKKYYKKIPNDFRYIGPHTLEQYKQSKIKLLENAPGKYIRVDIGESGQTYNRIEDEITEKKYINIK